MAIVMVRRRPASSRPGLPDHSVTPAAGAAQSPMRLGLIADIHADPRALEATLRHLEALRVEEIVCAGDLVGYGAEPDAVVTMLRDRAIPCIRGNHDRWALERRQVIGIRGWKPAAL